MICFFIGFVSGAIAVAAGIYVSALMDRVIFKDEK